ncbi:hypothetical protein NJB1907E19_15890 [Mycobacterium marinum]|nr:hypothetical protein NJB1907E90_19370 [Mycobacterium marinum]GJO35862.1 hypothetical protein NJB1907E19_15890 [Mycobacterium marinum]GJO74966.1 hypothetical protein NJB1728f31_03860 [Mycobacterium marinum]GJO81988.1 hypothetical protein NJB1907E49_28070 [Mycobacterium marinum]GJO87963.1 hypothetical protein NJB1728910S_24110 [Mycobacterium marinum]
MATGSTCATVAKQPECVAARAASRSISNNDAVAAVAAISGQVAAIPATGTGTAVTPASNQVSAPAAGSAEPRQARSPGPAVTAISEKPCCTAIPADAWRGCSHSGARRATRTAVAAVANYATAAAVAAGPTDGTKASGPSGPTVAHQTRGVATRTPGPG